MAKKEFPEEQQSSLMSSTFVAGNNASRTLNGNTEKSQARDTFCKPSPTTETPLSPQSACAVVGRKKEGRNGFSTPTPPYDFVCCCRQQQFRWLVG
jgi:hypothetical protein